MIENYHYMDSWGTKCPFCDNEQSYTGDSLDDNEEIEIECDSCNKTYTIRLEVSYKYYCYDKEGSSK